MRRLLVLLSLCACGSGDATTPDAGPLPPTDPAALEETLRDLAAFGEKRVGTPAGEMAATYMEARLRAVGLTAVHRESFRVPRWDAPTASLALVVNGAPRQVPFAVLEASGSGRIDAAVVRCGGATPADLAAVDVDGKIALVVRSVTYHRSSQYRNVAAAGARAMIYISDAPDNLVQVGSVRRGFEASGPIPAVSVGAVDGAALLAATSLRATVDVVVTATPASGHNVVGRVAGARPDQIVVGAHFDSWFTGSSDNGAGAAALIALASRRARKPAPRHTLVFVAYDGEEPGLYGGYDYMHKHRGVEPIVALLGFEVPAPREPMLLAFGRSNHAALDQAFKDAGIRGLYPIYVNMDAVPALFGGIIPTDVQGMYRDGVPTATTATSYAHYHTVEDTPERVDAAFLAQVVDAFDLAIDHLDASTAAVEPDPALWRATATVSRAAGKLAVTVTVTDAAGSPRGDAPVEAVLLIDDFTQAATTSGRTDDAGRVTLELPDVTGQDRYVHVSAGPSYPLVETVVRP